MNREEDLRLLQEANQKLAAIDVKGKDYVPVNERIKAFRNIYPRGSIRTDIVGLENGTVTMKAEVYDDEGRLLAVAHAQEKEGSSFINKTSFIENCCTSATGRALGYAGIGIDGSVCSYEEVANAKLNQAPKEQKIKPEMWDALKKTFNKEEIQEIYKEFGVTRGSDLPQMPIVKKIEQKLRETKPEEKDFY